MRCIPGKWDREVDLMETNISRDKRQFEIRPCGYKTDSNDEAVHFGGWGISRVPFFTSVYGDMEAWGGWQCFVS